MRYGSHRWWYGALGLLIVLFLLSPLSAQMGGLMDNDGGRRGPGGPGEPGGPTGPVGDTGGVTDDDAETDVPTPGPLSSDVGPIGRVDERMAHSECDTCFTVPGIDDYQIFESVTVDEEEVIIPRLVPNPAPIQADEGVRKRIDEETGEDIWYIGKQAYVGPTDEDYWSDEAPLTTIELKRIKTKYEKTIMSIPGVHGFGIGPAGFLVSLEPEQALNAEKALAPGRGARGSQTDGQQYDPASP